MVGIWSIIRPILSIVSVKVLCLLENSLVKASCYFLNIAVASQYSISSSNQGHLLRFLHIT